MQEKNILAQFKQLKSIEADASWKARNREVLLSQISGTQDAETAPAFTWNRYILNLPLAYAKALPQSALIAVFALLLVLGGGFASLQASKNSMPGDSLYMAKIVGEKTQYALTFDDKSKARLGLEFAENRAEELNQVLAENEASVTTDETVEQLVGDLKKEISNAKNRLEKINQGTEDKIADAGAGDAAAVNGNNSTAEEDEQMFSANAGKDQNGISISDNNIEAPVSADKKTTDTQATTTAPTKATEAPAVNPTEIIQQAKDLLQSNDINATLDMIDEAKLAIEGIEVKGADNILEVESEGASTSVETK